MHNIDENNGRRIAGDLIESYMAVSDAMVRLAALSTSMIEAEKDMRLAPADAHKALESVVDGFRAQFDIRARLIQAQRHMAVIKGQSDQAETNFGCLGDGPVLGQAKLRQVA